MIEKILERLEDCKTKRFVSGITNNPYEFGACHAMDIAIQIVQKVAQEYERCNKPSCTDCEVYDKEKHYCQKWCDVIKHTAEDLKQEYGDGWIPCSERLPERNEMVLASMNMDYVDIILFADNEQFYDESGGVAMADVLAWQPLPESFKQKGE